MAGSSCDGCVFSQYQDQTQTGCMLNRIEKYHHVDILNNENNGFYKVLPYNICAAKRNKSWLNQNSKNPTSLVRSELYPKIQLIILIDEVNDSWVQFFYKHDFDKYSTVDVLIFQSESQYIKEIGNLIYWHNFFIHTCFPVQRSFASTKGHHINNFVRQDCQFYLLVDNPNNNLVDLWPDKLDSYLNDECKSVYLTYDKDEYGNEIEFNNKLVYSPIHVSLGGYGSQDMYEKINIHCYNNDQTNLVVDIAVLWDSNTEEVSNESITSP